MIDKPILIFGDDNSVVGVLLTNETEIPCESYDEGMRIINAIEDGESLVSEYVHVKDKDDEARSLCLACATPGRWVYIGACDDYGACEVCELRQDGTYPERNNQ